MYLDNVYRFGIDDKHVAVTAWVKPRCVFSNCVWQAHRQMLVDSWWLPCVRAYKGMGYVAPQREWSKSRFWWSERVQAEIQEAVHVASKEDRRIAVKAWANVPLSSEDKEALLADKTPIAVILDTFASMVFEGYRLSVTWDTYSSAIQASLVCANPEDGNYGYGLSARHPDMDTALKSLLYKHRLTEDTGWRDFLSKPAVDSWS